MLPAVNVVNLAPAPINLTVISNVSQAIDLATILRVHIEGVVTYELQAEVVETRF